MISMRMLILSYTIQLVISNVCTNFKILDAVVSEKSLTWSEKWKKRKKEGKINFNIVVFFYKIYSNPQYVYTKFEDFGSHRS